MHSVVMILHFSTLKNTKSFMQNFVLKIKILCHPYHHSSFFLITYLPLCYDLLGTFQMCHVNASAFKFNSVVCRPFPFLSST